VLAVGASELTDIHADFNRQVVASYSNASAGIDLLAPGGNLETDFDQDGLPDGILSETINPADPTDIGYWLMCGTSQAAAQVSGLAVELRRMGLSALHAESVMKHKAEQADPVGGHGSGYADMDWAVPVVRPDHVQFLVALLPYQRGGPAATPSEGQGVHRPG
jgi:hypothetical protein